MSNPVVLDKFNPRPYQIPIIDAIENRGYKNVIAILPRRAGKDVACMNLAVRECLRKRCLIYYIYPSYAQVRKCIWDGITTEGVRFLDYIPPEVIFKKNEQQMKITFQNGSILQFIGSDDYDSLRGTNPQGVVFSEYSRQDCRVYNEVISQILSANNGWAVFISTPYGQNHFWDLYQMALKNDSWFVYKLTLDDTKHVPLSFIEQERKRISEDMIQQEWYTSFTLGVEGSFYAKYIDDMRNESRVGAVPWNRLHKVHTAWDLGYNDPTCIIFFQVIGSAIYIIDSYENNKKGLDHYASIIINKPYNYGYHIPPHDIAVHELSNGLTRHEQMLQLGVQFKMPTKDDRKFGLHDGIEAVRATLSRVWIDGGRCGKLIDSLENYRQEFDSKNKVYKRDPLHDWTSHYADAMRYLCTSLHKVSYAGLSADKLDKMYEQAVYGANQNSLPRFFRDDIPNY